MKAGLVFVALLVASAAAAQTPQQSAPQPQPRQGQTDSIGVPGGVQVAVPQGNAVDQARDQQRQRAAAAERARLAAKPLPRLASGRVAINNLGPDKGVWIGSNLSFVPPDPANASARPAASNAGIPYQDWARAVALDRRRNQLEPHTRCKPSGGPRQLLTPYGVEIVDLTESQQRVYIFDIGGPHTFRTVYMDGRTHPASLEPDFYGHSIGWWDGDTLVVDSVGYNEDFWIDRGNLPHTTQLHLVEKFTRVAFDQMKYEITIDDPGAYTKPFSGSMMVRWEPNTELFEYVCQQSNYASDLMVGEGTVVDRSSVIIP